MDFSWWNVDKMFSSYTRQQTIELLGKWLQQCKLSKLNYPSCEN